MRIGLEKGLKGLGYSYSKYVLLVKEIYEKETRRVFNSHKIREY